MDVEWWVSGAVLKDRLERKWCANSVLKRAHNGATSLKHASLIRHCTCGIRRVRVRVRVRVKVMVRVKVRVSTCGIRSDALSPFDRVTHGEGVLPLIVPIHCSRGGHGGVGG